MNLLAETINGVCLGGGAVLGFLIPRWLLRWVGVRRLETLNKASWFGAPAALGAVCVWRNLGPVSFIVVMLIFWYAWNPTVREMKNE